jgi:DNA-damage-inducible protein J
MHITFFPVACFWSIIYGSKTEMLIPEERWRKFMGNINVTIRMDKELKQEAEELFADFGIGLSAAITMFFKQAVREQSIPFKVTRNYNEETIMAIEEAKQIKNNPDIKKYATFKEALEDVKADV